MPVSTRSKAKAGKRGAKTTRDSASEKKAKRLEDGYHGRRAVREASGEAESGEERCEG
jgi:hypothetical protein